MTFELLERASAGDLTVFNKVDKQDEHYLPLLYAIPDTVKAAEIQQHITHLDPTWLLNRAIQVERQTGDVDDALHLLTLSDHPTAKQLHRDMTCYKHILCYFDERALLSRKLAFDKLGGELGRLPRVEQRRLALYLAERGQCYLQLLFDAFDKDECDEYANVELMEEIFG